MTKYNRLTFEERVKIETYNNLGMTLMEIASKLGRNKSTISREISRYPYSYRAEKADKIAQNNARYHNFGRRLDKNERLFKIVYRYLKKHWSPTQISTYLKLEYSDQPSMQISSESIYTYIYLLPRGELKKELALSKDVVIMLRFDNTLTIQDLVDVLSVGNKLNANMVLATKK